MSRLLLMILIALPLQLFGQTVQQRAEEAERLYQAKFYEQSLAEYESLDFKALSRSEQARVRFNMGMNHLALGHWDKARSLFEQVESGGAEDVLLRRQAAYHLALTYLEEAVEVAEQFKKAEEGSVQLVEKSQALLKQALRVYQEALERDRELAVVEGRAPGEEAEDLLLLRESAKEALALVVEWWEELRLAKLPLEEGVRQLLERLQESVERLDLIGRRSSPPRERQRLLMELAIAGKSLSPVWEALSSRLGEEEQKQDVFQQAHNHYLTALDLMGEGRGWEARNHLSQGVWWLSLLQLEESKGDVLSWALQKRLALRKQGATASGEYAQALLQDDHWLSEAVRQVAEQERAALLKSGPDIPLENQLQAKGLARLEGRQVPIPSFGQERAREAARDTILLNLLKQTEGETLLKAYAAAKAFPTVRAGQLSQANAQRELLLDQMAELRAKLADRRTLTKDGRQVRKIEGVMGILARLPSLDQEAWDPLVSALEEALLLWDGEKVVLVKLGELTDAYQALLARDSMGISDLARMVAGIEEVGRLVERVQAQMDDPTRLGPVQRRVDEAKSVTHLAQTQVTQGRAASARYLVQDGRQWVRRASEVLTSEHPLSPKAILEQAIREQSYTIDLTRHTQTEGEPLLAALLAAQGFVLEAVSAFQEAVIKAASPEDRVVTLDEARREDPWKEVYPLFEKGLERAEQAHARIALGLQELGQALGLQGDALAFWQRALERLKNEQQNQEGNGDGQPPPDSPPNQDDASSAQEEESSSHEPSQNAPDQLFELLQQMDRDDQLPPAKKAPTKQGLRPW